MTVQLQILKNTGNITINTTGTNNGSINQNTITNNGTLTNNQTIKTETFNNNKTLINNGAGSKLETANLINKELLKCPMVLL